MPRISQQIGKLTNSIENRISGDSFATDVIKLKVDELEHLTKGWKFNWSKEFSLGTVFKLVIRFAPEVIQGLISISDKGDHIFMNLIESAPHNYGTKKVYEGVAGNLVAFACKVSLLKGYSGIVVFEAKTKLIEHYKLTLQAEMITRNRMFIDSKPALYLIEKYFNE
jgi:hypothetical protein